MSAPQIVETTVYLLYSVLAFTAVLVLFASTIGLFALAARQVIRIIRSLVEAILDAGSPNTEPYVKTLNPRSFMVDRRVHRIPGGHNEHF
jgi:hypothetical protein